MFDDKPIKINPPKPTSPEVNSPKVRVRKGDLLLGEVLEIAGLSNSDGGSA